MKYPFTEDWTLFLDRDGTINKRLPGEYVWNYNQFSFLPDVLSAIPIFNAHFNHVIIVTNQQGIGKEIMNEEMLQKVHDKMMEDIHLSGGFIDEIYYCPDLEIHDPTCRKPNPGMALKAQQDFPEINFRKSIMIGDSLSDIQFGQRLGMKTVWIQNREVEHIDQIIDLVDYQFDSLISFAYSLI
jgi:histidinol-phosphate phosphatase family protein